MARSNKGAQSWEEMINEALEYADRHWRPCDLTPSRNELALRYCVQRHAEKLHPYPSIQIMIREMIENPHLTTAGVRAYREHFQKREWPIAPDLKCSDQSVQLRQEGNELYAQKRFEDALEKYNESISCAPNDSENLGIGYANRSAVYYEREEYELTLANIALAKRHHYPERLLPKLLDREIKCHEKLKEHPKTRKTNKLLLISEVNPRIPFLSKGISCRKLPIYNNSLVADQDFKAGDVILREKPLKVCVGRTRKFIHCNYCLSGNLLHLIPCPNCTSAMFCNEKCLQEGFLVHRFECGITSQLLTLNDFSLGPRMFFHGLTLFEDDVDKLMLFCQMNRKTDKTFFDVDYSSYDPLEEFQTFIGATVQASPDYITSTHVVVKMNAAIFFMTFMDNPLVQSLITTEAQKDFMVECFYNYMYLTMGMAIYCDPSMTNNGRLYPIASLCNHSCDPNTLALDYVGQLKFVVLRPIRRGEQILVSYGAHFSQPPAVRLPLIKGVGFRPCACDVCDEEKRPRWLARHKSKSSIPQEHWVTLNKVVPLGSETHAVPDANQMDALRQFVQRYAEFHPQENFCDVLTLYAAHLTACNKTEMEAEMRSKVTVF